MRNSLYQILHMDLLSGFSHWDKRCHLFQNKRIHTYFLMNFYKSNFYIPREKLCFTQFSTRMAAWLLLTFFICLHNQLSSIHSLSGIKEYKCLKNVIHQIDSKNEWLLLWASFTPKFVLVFVLTLENAFSYRFHLKANKKSIDSSKKRH